MPFFIIFIMIPLAEIIVFMRVSDAIGLGTALIMALMTALLGGAIVRHQGIQTMLSTQKNLQKGVLPSEDLFDGLCLVAAGATLITPGFITDALGFALLVPALRKMLRQQLLNSGRFHVSGGYTEYRQPYTRQDPNIIDVEYEHVDDDKDT